MGFIKDVWNWLGDNASRLLALLVIVGFGANIVTAIVQGWLKFPLAIKVLGVIAVLALIGLLIRTKDVWWPWLKGLVARPNQTAGGVSFIHAAPGARITGLAASGNLMQIGSSIAPVAVLAPIETSPAMLRQRVAAMKPLCDRLDSFLFERETIRDGIEDIYNRDWEAMRRSMDAASRFDQQTWAIYRREFSAVVGKAYEEARRRGFADGEMEQAISIPLRMRHGHSSFLPTIAQRLRVVMLQMEQRATDLEAGGQPAG